jgi:ABC-2 type transport system ATP-binding protein
MSSEMYHKKLLDALDAGNLAEAFSFLMKYAYAGNADDETMNRIVTLIAETDTDSAGTAPVRARIIALIGSIDKDIVTTPLQDDLGILKLSRNNYFSQTAKPVFSCSGLYKKFNLFELRNISIDLRVGEITAVVGRNGNGKTTLCRIVAGLLAKDDGKISYPYFGQENSADLDWGTIKSNIAYLSQDILPLQGTVENTLCLEAALHGIRGAENTRQVDFMIRRLGLVKYRDAEWGQLSGGYRLRFSLARILLWRPRLLILDEPLAHLDPKAQITVLSDLRDFADSINYPMSILMTSQHIHEAELIADKIIFLRDGEAIFYDSIERIGRDRKTNHYEIGCLYIPGEMEKILSQLNVVSISHNGLYFEVETTCEVSAAQILNTLNDAGIEISFFRDISNSTKKFLLENV